jgi:HAMP domain-containing protein
MDDTGQRKKKMRSYTVAALLGIFITAALLAVASRLLPERLSRLVKSTMNRGAGKES